MIEIHKNLFVGTEEDCRSAQTNGFAVVHACKHPCHQNRVGYNGNSPSTHPNYLILEDNSHC